MATYPQKHQDPDSIRISQLVAKLQELQAKHGDLVVCEFGFDYFELDDVWVVEDTGDCPDDYSPPQCYWDGHEKVLVIG